MDSRPDTRPVRAKLTVELIGCEHPARLSSRTGPTATSLAWSLELTADGAQRRSARGELADVPEREMPELLVGIIAEELRGLQLARRPRFPEPIAIEGW